MEMGICALLCMGWYLQPFPQGEGVQHWDLGVVFGRVSADLEGDLCVMALRLPGRAVPSAERLLWTVQLLV